MNAGGILQMRALLLFLARRESFKNFALKFGFFRNAASRFIAGENLDDAIRAVEKAGLDQVASILDLLGENTLSRSDAERACEELLHAQERIQQVHADCYLSIKLTQLGLSLDSDFCESNLVRIVDHAGKIGSFVCVDMEDSPYTERTLEIVERTHARAGNVGTVIQAYLFRSERDLTRLVEKGIRIRLVKGAYREPETVAYSRKKDTDANYLKLMKILMQNGVYPAIATHDPAIIRAAREFARSKNIPGNSFEFQMLYGIRRDLQYKLVREGYNVRLYIPYGSHWYPYFMRRLAERPANAMFLIRNLFIEKKFKG